jgi:hypothetical protein
MRLRIMLVSSNLTIGQKIKQPTLTIRNQRSEIREAWVDYPHFRLLWLVVIK